jgi:hypothetical protein
MTNLPLTGTFRVTCEYGRNGNLWASGYHKGIDLYSDNRDIYCTCDGVVRTVGYDKNGWGYYVRVENKENKNIHISCHFAKDTINVKVGQVVSRNTILGKMGSTGNSTGIHLHFQIEKSNNDRTVIDPTIWLGIPNVVGSYYSENYKIKENRIMTANDYKDKNKIPSWAFDAVNEATKDCIMMGDEYGNFNPNSPITRAEFAVCYQRMKGKFKK